MARRCESPDLASNPAGVYSMLQWLADTQLRKSIAVFMPYSDPLRDFAGWFVQLWAESLGRNGRMERRSDRPPSRRSEQPTSTLRFSCSWRDRPTRLLTFVSVRERETDVKIPPAFPDVKELGTSPATRSGS